MEKLTPAQQRLVEENMGLVGHTIHKYFPFLEGRNDYEDWMQVGYYGLCKAAGGYDQSQGIRFSTYGSKCIQNAIKRAMRGILSPTRKPEIPNASMDDAYGEGNHHELIADPLQNTEQSVWDREKIREALSLTQNDPLVFLAAIGRLTQCQAADKLGVTHQAVHRKIARLRQKMEDSNL